jgi:hypothetical protein
LLLLLALHQLMKSDNCCLWYTSYLLNSLAALLICIKPKWISNKFLYILISFFGLLSQNQLFWTSVNTWWYWDRMCHRFRLRKWDDYFWVVLATFKVRVIFWGTFAVSNIGSSLNPNHHNRVFRVQIRETLWINNNDWFWISSSLNVYLLKQERISVRTCIANIKNLQIKCFK